MERNDLIKIVSWGRRTSIDEDALLEKHGYLWLLNNTFRTCASRIDGEENINVWICKSIATGFEYRWAEDEFEVAKKEELS